MPIPDSIVKDQIEQDQVAKNYEIQQRTIDAANALISSSLSCPNIKFRTYESCRACGKCKEIYDRWFSIGA